MKERRYAVLGAGRQGKAAAYDLAKFGNVSEVILADRDTRVAVEAADELNLLLRKDVIRPIALDVANSLAVHKVLHGVDGFVSATHYKFNPALTKIAIDAGCHMVDLGGNTAVVLEQHKLDRSAASTGVWIIFNCGMAPGFNLNLVCHALTYLPNARKLTNFCGGVPQNPKPPLGYHFPFALSGLVNECSGSADIIRGGKIDKQACLGPIVEVLLPEIGIFEATHTSGGLSTAPWTLNKQYPLLESFEYMTLRYPGHWKIVQDLAAQGKLESGLESLARVTPLDLEDLGIISVHCKGFDSKGKPVTAIVEVIDRYDDVTGFTAMQRLTGFHASIMLMLATEKLQGGGVIGVESVDSTLVIDEFAKRGITVDVTIAKSA